jgi:hypothetical protein
MRIYLDNCCFNRPYDDQTQIRIRIESEAKLFIQAKILAGEIELAWSYVLDFENKANPFPERRWSIAQWKAMAIVDVIESSSILEHAEQFESQGLRGKDALHVACAIETGCECFLTTDDHVIRLMGSFELLLVMNPTTFVTTQEQYK